MIRTVLVLCFFFGSCVAALAEPLSQQDVPEPLRPWIKWSLHGYKEQECPFFYNGIADRTTCQWPSRLELKLAKDGGEFSQRWQVFAEGWTGLPGEREHWPQEVQVNGQPVVVNDRGGVPSLYLQPGEYTVSGRFVWESLPQALQIPATTGLITLTLDEQTVEFPQIDESGKVWLRQGVTDQEKVEDRLDLKVYRRITDEIPLMVTTRIDLQVSGKQREVVLGQALTAEYIPMSLNSPLPARLEPDGHLRIQVRAGEWTVILIARHTGTALHAIPLPRVTGGQWPEEEVWVFEARPHLRQVEISGVPAIDPQQTTLPSDWRSFPTYIVKAGEALQLVEKKRGDPEPAPDQLMLQRHWWLDFDGRGYTVQDTISGIMTRGWRLDLDTPGTLGRVAIDGQEQFITKSDTAGRAGVELRRGQVSLVADSRLEEARAIVPAVGWDHDFHQVSGQLHLPPGWRVITASGVDYMPGTWLERWTLMDLFVVFLIALAVAKLWGRLWGIVALLALALIAHEYRAPWWMWLHVLAATALLRVLPVGWPRRLAIAYRVAALVLLLIISLTFMVQQARWGLYPQLERGWGGRQGGLVGSGLGTIIGGVAGEPRDRMEPALAPAPMVQSQMAQDETLLPEEGKLEDLSAMVAMDKATSKRAEAMARRAPTPSSPDVYEYAARSKRVVAEKPAQYDPNAAIQTGPGLPRWEWTTLNLGWSGPVEHSQTVHFVLFSPRVNLLLTLVRILLVGAVLLCVFDIRYTAGKLTLPSLPNASAATGLLLCMLVFLSPLSSRAQETFPSPELLNDLRNRLTQKDPPECIPMCATSPRLRVEIIGDTLRLRQEVHAGAQVAIPLPGQQRHWLPQTVLLDGNPARGLNRHNGRLWIVLPTGARQVIMEGVLPARDSVELALPLRSYFVEVSAAGWEVDGVHEDGVADNQLQLRRVRSANDRAAAVTLEPGTLPPFVRVERTLQLGLTWSVQTRVLRVSPHGTTAVIEVPLLDGESVTTAGTRVESGKVQVNMAPGDTEVGWSSVLEQRGQLTLAAPETTVWTEIWKLDVSPIWRVLPTGIPVVHHSDQSSGQWLPEWHPWPGETVTLDITRPEGVPGQTLTVDKSLLQVTPGRRATDVVLHLTLRSSRGGSHSLTLPETATVQSVHINGQSQAIRQEGRTVTIPLTPGTQEVSVQWRQTDGVTASYVTPTVDVGSDSVNAAIQLQVPRDRWVLFCHGPQMGPAVLFWSAAFVVLLGAIALGRLPFTPLRTHEWILLGIGFSAVFIKIMLVVVGWLLALEFRKRLAAETRPLLFNLIQLALVALTIVALGAFLFVVQGGLLGAPEMRIAGNGSSNLFLHWYQDRTGPVMPQGWMFSLPLWTYRVAMLAWALWVAFALIRWLRWGWECFSTNGLWKKVRRKAPARGESSPLTPAPQTEPTAE